jgi:hypothetical protein
MADRYTSDISKYWVLANTSDAALERMGADPNCIESEACVQALAERIARRKKEREEQRVSRAARREELQDYPFDPRTEVSADAKHIVKHLWILFVLLPIIGFLLFVIVSAIK